MVKLGSPVKLGPRSCGKTQNIARLAHQNASAEGGSELRRQCRAESIKPPLEDWRIRIDSQPRSRRNLDFME